MQTFARVRDRIRRAGTRARRGTARLGNRFRSRRERLEHRSVPSLSTGWRAGEGCLAITCQRISGVTDTRSRRDSRLRSAAFGTRLDVSVSVRLRLPAAALAIEATPQLDPRNGLNALPVASGLSAEQLVEFPTGRRIRKPVEAAVLRNRFCCSHEPTPGTSRKRTADADATHAERREVIERQIARPADQHVDGLRSDCVHDRTNLLAGADPRRVETIGAGVRIRLEPRDRLVEVRASDDEPFGAPDEQRIAA